MQLQLAAFFGESFKRYHHLLPVLDHIREAIWADLMQVAMTPGGGALSVERVNRLLTLEQIEVDRIVAVLADVLPEQFAEALELAIDCRPLLPHEEIPYPETVRGVGGEWVSRALDEFWRVFPLAVEGGVDLAAELDRAGSREAVAAAWGVQKRSIHARVRRILLKFPEEPDLDGLAGHAFIWQIQDAP